MRVVTTHPLGADWFIHFALYLNELIKLYDTVQNGTRANQTANMSADFFGQGRRAPRQTGPALSGLLLLFSKDSPYLQQRPVDSFVPHLNSSTLIGRGSYGAAVYEYLWSGITVAVKKIQKSLVPDYKIEIEVLQNRLTRQSLHLIHYYTHAEDFEFW